MNKTLSINRLFDTDEFKIKKHCRDCKYCRMRTNGSGKYSYIYFCVVKNKKVRAMYCACLIL